MDALKRKIHSYLCICLVLLYVRNSNNSPNFKSLDKLLNIFKFQVSGSITKNQSVAIEISPQDESEVEYTFVALSGIIYSNHRHQIQTFHIHN